MCVFFQVVFFFVQFWDIYSHVCKSVDTSRPGLFRLLELHGGRRPYQANLDVASLTLKHIGLGIHIGLESNSWLIRLYSNVTLMSKENNRWKSGK
ncbi:hypothetical protein BD779DRAFT_1569517, partial [Infundibulicybe gibba]